MRLAGGLMVVAGLLALVFQGWLVGLLVIAGLIALWRAG